MDFLCLFGCCDFTGSDGPDGLVGDDDLGPFVLGEALSDGIELSGDNFEGLVGFALLFRSKETVSIGVATQSTRSG